MSNYPPGVSENTFGAPWNTEDYECVFKVYVSTSFDGPLSREDYRDEVQRFVKEIESQLLKIDYVDDVVIQ